MARGKPKKKTQLCTIDIRTFEAVS